MPGDLGAALDAADLRGAFDASALSRRKEWLRQVERRRRQKRRRGGSRRWWGNRARPPGRAGRPELAVCPMRNAFRTWIDSFEDFVEIPPPQGDDNRDWANRDWAKRDWQDIRLDRISIQDLRGARRVKRDEIEAGISGQDCRRPEGLVSPNAFDGA